MGGVKVLHVVAALEVLHDTAFASGAKRLDGVALACRVGWEKVRGRGEYQWRCGKARRFAAHDTRSGEG